MSTLNAASRQWSSRPADERYWDLAELEQHLLAEEPFLRKRDVSYDQFSLNTVEGSDDIFVEMIGGQRAALTNWSFNQLCKRIGEDANYLKSKKTPLALSILRDTLGQITHTEEVRQSEDDEFGGWDSITTSVADTGKMKMVVFNDDNPTVRCVVSTEYGLQPDLPLVQILRKIEPSGWRNPPARPAGLYNERTRKATADDVLRNQQGNHGGLNVKEGDIIAPAGIYRGKDARNFFAFLVNDRVVVGEDGEKRGFYISNSEVGETRALEATLFLYKSVCGNHIIWDASGVQSVRKVHRKNSIKDFPAKLHDLLDVYTNAPPLENDRIKAAKLYALGKNEDEVIERLYKEFKPRLQKKVAQAAFKSATQWEHNAGSPPVSAWGMSYGLSFISQQARNIDVQSNYDKLAGDILDLVPRGLVPTTVNVPAVIS